MVVLTNYLVKTLKLIVIMITMTLFVAFFWFIFCDIRLTLGSLMLIDEEDQLNFIEYNGLEGNDIYQQCLTFIYFSFTTLSTVGFGDYHPRTNIERFLGAFILLSGVTITSYITESLSSMIV